MSNQTSSLARNIMLETLEQLAEKEQDDELDEQVQRRQEGSKHESTKMWFPKTQGLTPTDRAVLMVPFNGARKQMNRGMLLELLANRLTQEVKDDPHAAASGLEMSSESAPELWQIKQMEPQKNWGSALAYSDGIMRLMAKIDWDQESENGIPMEQPEAISLLELMERIA